MRDHCTSRRVQRSAGTTQRGRHDEKIVLAKEKLQAITVQLEANRVHRRRHSFVGRCLAHPAETFARCFGLKAVMFERPRSLEPRITDVLQERPSGACRTCLGL